MVQRLHPDNGERIIARVLGGEDVKVLGTVIGKWEDG
jgi:hypothetical protein